MKDNNISNRLNSIRIYTPRVSFPGGKAYLCANGTLSSEPSHAAIHWDIQFDAIVAENWIVQPAIAEIVQFAKR